MLSLFGKLVSISIIFLFSTCIHSESYSNSQAQIVDNDGQIIAGNLNMLMPSDTDIAICSSLKSPSKLPYISYGDANGFNACISRCLTFVVMQICPQLPVGKSLLATKPELFDKMLASCNEDINSFVTRGIQCPYVKCKPY
jgi:hypothetical protein